MKKILFVALAAVGMAACVQNEELAVSKDGSAIKFDNVFVDNATKAAIDGSYTTAKGNLDHFNVWATIGNSGVSTNIFENLEVTKNGSAWTYDASLTQYWIPGNDYEFVGVVDGTVTVSDDARKMPVSIATNLSEQKDVLYATVSRTYNNGDAVTPVHLQFNHLLAKVKFTINNVISTASSDLDYVVEGIKIVGVEDEVEYTIGGAWTVNSTYDVVFGPATNNPKADNPTADRLGYGASAESNWERLILPGENKPLNIVVDYKLYKDAVCIGDHTGTATVATLDIEAGKAYNFVLALGNPGAPIEFTAEVKDWVDAIPSIDNTFAVATAEDLATIAEMVQAGEDFTGKTVSLVGDIDLSATTRNAVASNWTPIGSSDKPFTGAFDGNGYTIKNLALVESEAKEGKAYIGFFGYAKNATIKNVTFENVYINIPCLDIDHSQGHIGAVAGSLEGTSTVENVTVKGDIQVYATQDANGASRVAVVAGGNSYGNVTMKNVHVVANEGSYLKANNNTGALAGQLQGKMVFENCSSNIDVTVNKFFAGGLVGIAAGDSYFKNCHTTGNVAVVAGREGRHNDEYRVGGIAGGWADGATKVCTLENCSYTGTVSGQNADGAVAEPLDYMGYVGRGYTLANCAGSKVIINGTEFVQLYNDKYGIYQIFGEGLVENAVDFIAAVNNVADGGVVTLGASFSFTTEEGGRTNNGGWWDGLGYSGDKSFTIDLNGYTVGNANGALNDYLFWFQNNGEKASTITIKNGTLDAGTTAYCALCTASSNKQTLTVNVENVNLINNNSNGSTVKVRGGSILNVKAGTKITGKNSYLGIENWKATVNIYDGAEIYMNGTTSYNGCLVGVGGNGTINVYGGYGKGVSGGLIAMTSGGTINVYGGEWIANTDGTYANGNKSVLIAQSDKQYNAGAGNAVVNVTGGTFKGGYNCYGNAVGDAQINISGGNYNANPTAYVTEGYQATDNGNGTWTVK